MKIKVISRDPNVYLRSTKNDIHRVPRNYDPVLHPLQPAREYTRALNATKLERVFAKPFLCSLDGHSDGVSCMVNHPLRLSVVLSGAYDGEIRSWNLKTKQCTLNFQAHSGYIRGIAITRQGDHFYTVGDDMIIKLWSIDANEGERLAVEIPVSDTLYDISHSYMYDVYATCGRSVHVWEHNRSTPIRTFNWDVDSVHKIRFSPVEPTLFAALANDRSTILYDYRMQDPLRKVVMKLRSNAIAWNPMEAFVFTVASEDYNLYSFDARKLTAPFKIHQGHVEAVMDVDYCPTGREFVSGGYDKTLRIFPQGAGKSRDVYHTKRMQRVMTVLWTSDSKYVLSGSDEMNIRMWKATAWEKLGPRESRERNATRYAEKLKEKYAKYPEIRRIAQHRHVPKHVYHARKEHETIRQSQRRKESNRRAHSKPGTVPTVPERKKCVVKEDL